MKGTDCMVKLQIFVNGLWFFVGNFVNEVAAWANVADKPGRYRTVFVRTGEVLNERTIENEVVKEGFGDSLLSGFRGPFFRKRFALSSWFAELKERDPELYRKWIDGDPSLFECEDISIVEKRIKEDIKRSISSWYKELNDVKSGYSPSGNSVLDSEKPSGSFMDEIAKPDVSIGDVLQEGRKVFKRHRENLEDVVDRTKTTSPELDKRIAPGSWRPVFIEEAGKITREHWDSLAKSVFRKTDLQKVVEPLEGNGFDKKFHIVTHFGKRLAISEKNAKRSDFVDRWKHLMACQANPMWRVEL